MAKVAESQCKDLKDSIRALYGLRVFYVFPLEKGVMNSNFILNTDKGKYVFKIYNQKKAGEIGFEIDTLNELEKHDFPSPRLLKNSDGRRIGAFNSKPCLLYEYIEGDTKETWDESILSQVGVLMARMHNLLHDFKNRSRRFLWDHEEIKRLVSGEGRKLVKAGFPGAEELLKFLRSQLADISFPPDLPTSVTHQDFKPENVIIRDGKAVGIVDFDNSYYGTLLHDITTTVIWSCFRNEELDRSLLGALLSGYQSVRPLTENEKSSFDKALRFRLLREMFITPYATLHRIALAKERSDYFRRCYEKLKTGSVSSAVS